jgi:hypothetical protein
MISERACAEPGTRSASEIVNTIADLQNSKRTLAYLYSGPTIQTLSRFGAEQDKKFGLQADCTSQPHVKLLNVILHSPIDFPDGSQHPTKGVWQIRYQFERCGASKVYNAMFIADSHGAPPKSGAYFPGSSCCDPLLLKDAMMSALQGAMFRSGNKTCKEFEIFDIQVSEQPHDVGERKGVWSEVWTFRWCGEMVDVPMTFAPDPDGGGVTFRCRLTDSPNPAITAKDDAFLPVSFLRLFCHSPNPAPRTNVSASLMLTPNDDAQAVNSLRKAAEAGHPRNMNNLGVMYRDGRGACRRMMLRP